MVYRHLVVFSLLLFCIFSCVKYKKVPLVPSEVLQELETIRKQSDNFKDDQIAFDQIANIMSENSLQLKLIRTKYDSINKVAKIKTPWFNPSLEFGPDFGTSLESHVSNKVVPYVGLGFTVPLGRKLKKNNDLNTAKAWRALLEVQAQHRELYLSLRETYTLFYLALKKGKINKEIITGSQVTLKFVKNLMNAGSVDSLETGLTELEAIKINIADLEIRQDIEKNQSDLAILIGLDLKYSSEVSLPSFEKINLPSTDQLRLLLVKNHLNLARLRFDYEIAEKELCLEISKQYPDIQLGGERSGETGDSKIVWGLRVGVTVPVFDRNQHGIALAFGKREEIRQEYMALMHKVLTELDNDIKSFKFSFKKYEMITNKITPTSNSNLLIADQMLKAGGIDIFRYLSILRNHQENLMAAVNLEAEVRIALLHLEKKIGFPIFYLPGEQEMNLPLEIENLDKSEKSNEE